MKLNILKLAHLARPRTHEGAPAAIITPEQALRRRLHPVRAHRRLQRGRHQLHPRTREQRAALNRRAGDTLRLFFQNLFGHTSI